ncbi:hypothetical protein [Azospirillum sp. SYSU D00513]|nr:hypothetical protein [Azospirillum sp. SYSU D00513]
MISTLYEPGASGAKQDAYGGKGRTIASAGVRPLMAGAAKGAG